MTADLLLPIVVASLMGSLHCAGMCGGFVAAYTGQVSRSPKTIQHLAYNLGRLVTYVGLGALAGALGRAIDLAGSAAGIARTAAFISGFVLTSWGFFRLLEVSGHWHKTHVWFTPPQWLTRLSYFWFDRHRDKPAVLRAWLMGLSSTLLPCGWLYAFVVSAAGAGSIRSGALIMAAFWLGTVPMLLGLGLGMAKLSSALRQRLPVVSALLLTGVGVFTIVTRLNLPAFTIHSAQSADAHPPACHTVKPQ